MKFTMSILILMVALSGFAVEKNTWQAQWIGVHPQREVEVAVEPRPEKISIPEIVIIKAIYGVADDPSKQIDVTAKFQQLVDVQLSKAYDPRKFRFKVDNKLAGQDPAKDIEKVLRLEYVVNAKRIEKTVKEGGVVGLLPVPKKKKEPVDPNENQWSCFRNVVALDEAPRKAMARIAVDSKYWLWINGEQVVFEGQLKRGPTPDDTYYDEVDLAPYLKKGDNTIALLVWYFGKDGFSHKSSGTPGQAPPRWRLRSRPRRARSRSTN
ncbi:hypothetical protein PDESU_02169 [Pontiella desulfatans]|uniref:Bacterial alpha-L-rhamnosidase N-terminal domain-containing protein n=1 Tax=Pontiella desulfatans TaxID=2750659 RepID=A0A6C2U0Z8_PONDE|nr:hypothetical protein [Pontiella desulfatans]VGO13612.1 hypothetical protein PDESU_02169 [Pontiella desulfatans]